MSVSLTKKLKKYVRDKVDNGTFESASEVIRQGHEIEDRRAASKNTFQAGGDST